MKFPTLRCLPFLLSALVSLSSCSPPTEEELRARSVELSQKFIIADTHIDVPYRLREKPADISGKTRDGDFDYPRARDGGLDIAFMSVYVPASYETGGARQIADSLIDLVEGVWTAHPGKFAPAYTVAQAKENHLRGGIISLPMGMENGSPVEHDLTSLMHFYERGIRYITLAHSKCNHICDSSYDTERLWNGLSPFGREVVTEMNRLGIMVDVSHISDSAFYQVLSISKAPVIASHSSCRNFTPGWERNMSDDMIRALAARGGVIQINFGSSFLTDDLRKKWSEAWPAIQGYLDEHKLAEDDEEAKTYIRTYREEHQIGYADVADVTAHIGHVVQLVGVDHVGFGSDFDGVGDSLPTGLKDVSMYPNIILALLKLGYAERDVEKICGGNLLRVWGEVEQTATRLQGEAS